MSDNWLELIPTDPNFQPTSENAERARSILASITPEAESVVAEFKEQIELFHCGGNLERINCPTCGADLLEWFGDAVDLASDSEFKSLETKTPCCGAVVSLNNLKYYFPMGFGRFVLSAMNPNVADIQIEEINKLAEILGCPLRRIWVHL